MMQIKTVLLRLKKYIITRHVIFSTISALILTCTYYFANNLPLFTGEDLNQQLWTQKICEWLGWSKNIDYSNVVFINVSYDKELIPVLGEGPGEVIGSSVITDRRKLYKFLYLLNKSQEYKYLLLDIIFDKDDITEHDDSLFSLLGRMNKLVFVDHDSIQIEHPELKKKAGLAEYYSTITATNFARYEYINNDKRYLPLKVFEDLNPDKKVSRYGWGRFSLYFTQGYLCQNSCFLSFDSSHFDEYTAIENRFGKNIKKKNYYNLGSEFINLIDDSIYTEEVMIESIARLTNGKYVIIGNMKEDMHDTYMGPKPGCLILYRALQTLEEGKNIVTAGHLFIWGIIFFLITLFICKEKSILMYIPYIRNVRCKFLHYSFDIFSFGIFLFCCQFLEYVYCNSVHSLVIPFLYFSAIKLVFPYKKYQVV